MGSPSPQTTTPETTVGFSHEYALDVLTQAPDTWTPVRFSSQIEPDVVETTEDGATYDDAGSPHPYRTGVTLNVSLHVQQHRLDTGLYMPEFEVLHEAARTGGEVTIRCYDAPKGRKGNPKDAWKTRAKVSTKRANTANSGLGGWNVTLTGVGQAEPIENPKKA